MDRTNRSQLVFRMRHKNPPLPPVRLLYDGRVHSRAHYDSIVPAEPATPAPAVHEPGASSQHVGGVTAADDASSQQVGGVSATRIPVDGASPHSVEPPPPIQPCAPAPAVPEPSAQERSSGASHSRLRRRVQRFQQLKEFETKKLKSTTMEGLDIEDKDEKNNNEELKAEFKLITNLMKNKAEQE